MKHIISAEIKEASRLTSDEWKEWTKTVWSIANISDSMHPAVFPPEIPYRLIRMFSFVGETVLDPFSGMATTGKVAIKNGRTYIGFETNEEYCRESLRRIQSYALEEKLDNPHYAINNASSCNMSQLDDNSIGIAVTSPPYWNKADYGAYCGNIGGYEYYDDFLNDLKKGVFRMLSRAYAWKKALCRYSKRQSKHQRIWVTHDSARCRYDKNNAGNWLRFNQSDYLEQGRNWWQVGFGKLTETYIR